MSDELEDFLRRTLAQPVSAETKRAQVVNELVLARSKRVKAFDRVRLAMAIVGPDHEDVRYLIRMCQAFEHLELGCVAYVVAEFGDDEEALRAALVQVYGGLE